MPILIGKKPFLPILCNYLIIIGKKVVKKIGKID